ncbi:uncharacterized protein LOC110827321 isoform X2 [Zootermopsis nevadensis]|uniref:E3 ubiquitin-protein ligase n=2 Tax=Zootermopsis nevadensis TaxID=136037 RepID=A0A067RDW6_ZOONE|nr:uncharacterized protein LOC110827321 isoform X2 [Zootermopsis nevadensis]XP_021914583.1 uncharacterized protein LOC110827321 isoform X2 [Zootermopsis nevadensis]XP_021914584.1 uncharacterized protein LOC110827321 isoform X2 [Zootermopsis nevadensis]KDR22056.1 E3 ubiquitin-protein ligase [Zootermopsis nevadensis]
MEVKMNTLEVGNDVIDLTTDDCNEVILLKNPASNVNASVITLADTNDTEDVKFLGRYAKFIPVITISDSDTLESKCNNEDIKSLKSLSSHTSQCSRAISNFGILNNKCALNDTASCKLEASSKLDDLSEQSEGCGELKRKCCSIKEVVSQAMKIMKTTDKAHAFERQATACYQQKQHSINSEYNIQIQNAKNELLTKVKHPKNEISNWKIKNEHDENGSKAHLKKPKIKVKVIMKKPGPGINGTQQNTKNHKTGSTISDHVKKEDLQNVSSNSVIEEFKTEFKTPCNESVRKEKYMGMKNNSCSNKISNQVMSRSKREPINEPIAKEEISDSVSNIVKKLKRVIESNSVSQTDGNGECGTINKIHDEASSDHTEQSITICSQLDISTSEMSSHVTESVEEGSSCNENIQALPSSVTTADEQREDYIPDVQLLPVKMTITECENQVVYTVPLLRLPVQKQIIYFSRDYIEAFLKKIRDAFSVEKFLRAIPDPFIYFRKERSNERKYNDECLALMYLKSKYRKIPFPDIAFIFEKNRQSLTLSCDELDVWRSSQRRTNRKIGTGCGCPKPHELSMSFVHEVTFIENKRVIENHLQSKKRKKTTTFEIAKLRGELQQCGRCGVTDLMIEDMAPCSVFHHFCKICIQNVVDSRLLGCENPFSCLRKECQYIFSMEVLKKAVKPVTFSCLLHIRHLKEMEMRGIKLLETCPYCGFADIPPKDDQVFCCLNLDCMRETCRQCKGPNHTPYPCVMAIRPQMEISHTVTNRSDQYQNQLQNTKMHPENDIVQQNSLLQQRPQSVMLYPQQPLIHHPQETFNHCQPQPLMQHYQEPLHHCPQQPLMQHQQSSSVQQSLLPFM